MQYFVTLQMSDGQSYTILLHLQIHLKCKCCCCWLENLGLMFRFSAVSNAAWVQPGWVGGEAKSNSRPNMELQQPASTSEDTMIANEDSKLRFTSIAGFIQR